MFGPLVFYLFINLHLCRKIVVQRNDLAMHLCWTNRSFWRIFCQRYMTVSCFAVSNGNEKAKWGGCTFQFMVAFLHQLSFAMLEVLFKSMQMQMKNVSKTVRQLIQISCSESPGCRKFTKGEPVVCWPTYSLFCRQLASCGCWQAYPTLLATLLEHVAMNICSSQNIWHPLKLSLHCVQVPQGRDFFYLWHIFSCSCNQVLLTVVMCIHFTCSFVNVCRCA